MDFLALPHKNFSERNTLPTIEAVYFITSDNVLLYVGQTTNLRHRLICHDRVKLFNLFRNVIVSWCDMTGYSKMYRMDTEDSFVQLHKPLINAVRRGSYIVVNWKPLQVASTETGLSEEYLVSLVKERIVKHTGTANGPRYVLLDFEEIKAITTLVDINDVKRFLLSENRLLILVLQL